MTSWPYTGIHKSFFCKKKAFAWIWEKFFAYLATAFCQLFSNLFSHFGLLADDGYLPLWLWLIKNGENYTVCFAFQPRENFFFLEKSSIETCHRKVKKTTHEILEKSQLKLIWYHDHFAFKSHSFLCVCPMRDISQDNAREIHARWVGPI